MWGDASLLLSSVRLDNKWSSSRVVLLVMCSDNKGVVSSWEVSERQPSIAVEWHQPVVLVAEFIGGEGVSRLSSKLEGVGELIGSLNSSAVVILEHSLGVSLHTNDDILLNWVVDGESHVSRLGISVQFIVVDGLFPVIDEGNNGSREVLNPVLEWDEEDTIISVELVLVCSLNVFEVCDGVIGPE